MDQVNPKRKERQASFNLMPRKGFTLFPLLVLLQVIVYALMVSSGVDPIKPSAEDLLGWGGIFRTSIMQDQEYWRLFTAIFVHAGFFHLFMNGLKIWLLGSLLEPKLGKLSSFLIFFLGGFSSSIVSMSWNSATVAVGSSGAAFAMLGAYLVTLIFSKRLYAQWLAPSLLIFILVSVDLVFSVFQQNMDNAAHIGGFSAGLVLGALCLPKLRKVELNTLSSGLMGLVGMLLLIASFLLIQNLNDPVGDYRVAFKEFAVQEDSAMMAFDVPDSTKQEDKVQLFEGHVSYWKNAEMAFHSIALSELPAGLQTRISNLVLYAQLRQKQFQLVGQYYSTAEDRYFDEAEVLAQQITQLRESLLKKRDAFGGK